MTIEFEDAPPCCQQAIGRIHRFLEAGECLAEILAVAPSLSLPSPRISALGLLWKLGSGTAAWNHERERTRRMVNAITRNRVYTVIDLEIIRHVSSGERELELQWTRIRRGY